MRCPTCQKGRMFRSKQTSFERLLYSRLGTVSVAMCCVHESQDVAGSGGAAGQAVADLDWLSGFRFEACSQISSLDRDVA